MKAAAGFKPTIATSQADTVLFSTNVDEAREKYNQIVLDCVETGADIPPKLIVFAEGYSSTNNGCMVVYKGLEYQLSSISRGVDVLIKLSAVLGLNISKVSKLVWIFIREHLYNIKSKHAYANIDRLQQYLKTQVQ